MAKPTFLRYLPARLKPLSSPAIWAPLTIFALLSAFLWEYHRNPDWFNRAQVDDIAPESNLTPEEAARLSEIDTLEVLMEGSRLRGNLPETAGLTDPASSEAGAAEGATPSDGLAGRDNPFAAYEEEYKFPGAGNRNAITPTAPSSSANLTPAPASGSSAVTSSALADALARQRASSEATQPANNSSTPGSQPTRPNSNGINSSGSNSGGFSGNLPSSSGNPSSTSPAPSSSGITTPFIPTTTNMSPPPGTTGYQTPASSSLPVFNAPPQQPTQGPFSGNQAIPQNNIPRNNFRQLEPAAPAAAPVPAAPFPNANSYTPPSFTQPEQTRRVR